MRRRKKDRSIIVSSMLAVLAVLGARAHGAVWPLAPGESIQSAVDDADPGDEIVLAPGYYRQTVDLRGRMVTIRSVDPGDASVVAATVLDGDGLGSVIVCAQNESRDTILDGLTITGGAGTAFGPDRLGGGIYLYDASPTVRRCVIEGNVAHAGGGIACLGGSPLIEASIVRSNIALAGQITTGGGGLLSVGGGPVIVRSAFENNDAASWGGGLNIVGGAPLVAGCLVAGNTAGDGGGVRTSLAAALLVNCTIVDNTGAYAGGLRNSSNGTPATVTLRNSIVWSNTPASIVDLAGATTDASYCDVEGGWPGAGNLAVPPDFLDEDDGAYRPGPVSPCLDAGENAAVPPELPVDLDGAPRIDGPSVDLGAFERPFGCRADLDRSGAVDLGDVLVVLLAWGPCPACAADLDGSGEVDLADLLGVLAAWGCASGGT